MSAAERFGAPAQIRLSELSLSRPPGEPKIMAVMTGYFDDSRTDGEVLTVAGFVGDERQWDQFERTWSPLLERHGVPYFHMREIPNKSGPFAKWLPPQDHAEEHLAFFTDIVETIGACRFGAFGAIVRTRDLDQFNADKGLSLDPYSLAVYACLLQISKVYPDQFVTMIFDSIEQVHSRLKKAEDYAQSDASHPEAADYVQLMPLPRKATWRNVKALQAADFLVWEIRKHHTQQKEWWELPDRPSDWQDRFEHYQEWSKKKHGTRLPPPRKSLGALAMRQPLNGMVFDYRGLSLAHDARGGIWSLASSLERSS
jgi:hypothetical protein